MKTTKTIVRFALVALVALAVLAVPAAALAKPAVAQIADPAVKAEVAHVLQGVDLGEPAPITGVAHLAHPNPAFAAVISRVATIGAPPVKDPAYDPNHRISVLVTRVPEPRHPSTHELPYTGGDSTPYVIAGLLLAAAGAAVLFVRKPAASSVR